LCFHNVLNTWSNIISCRFSSVFPSVQSAIKKREQSLQDYTRTQAKYNKYQDRDRTGQNIVKLDTVSIHIKQERPVNMLTVTLNCDSALTIWFLIPHGCISIWYIVTIFVKILNKHFLSKGFFHWLRVMRFPIEILVM
jgi:hypothetical protein